MRNLKFLYSKSALPKVADTCDVCSGPLMQRKGDDQKTVLYRLQDYHKNVKPVIDAIKQRFPSCEVDTSKWPMGYWEQFYRDLRTH